ncbi:hypothetical protein [Chryseobacterium indoltheticum]|uniref:Uncharacterized protein n=1 Tax=Chryseobacterium indoltheticum TaxID=254 RepID=A0A3G6MWG8_9FLAO|nr:hypothetical protein [Chryseobacterium indoltheticum]AZA60092.1 hypothetical protein EG340_03125 [Chryseobacterium indoltheticum]
MQQNRSSAKKRMMFIQKEDYNFLAYSMIILLKFLDCTSEAKRFRDFRKIAYLVDFVNEGGEPSMFEEQHLADIYNKAQIKKKLLHHLIIVLKNRNLISVSLNKTSQTIDLWLNKEAIPVDFFDAKMFENEIENVAELQKTLTTRVRSMTIKNLVEKIFNDNNILTWGV